MHIEVHTTHQITSQESLKAEVAGMVEHTLKRFADHLSGIDVHLDDENGAKGGIDDIRCTIEARVIGQQVLAVTEHAASVAQATQGAAGKLSRSLDSALGRQLAKQRSTPGIGELSATLD